MADNKTYRAEMTVKGSVEFLADNMEEAVIGKTKKSKAFVLCTANGEMFKMFGEVTFDGVTVTEGVSQPENS